MPNALDVSGPPIRTMGGMREKGEEAMVLPSQDDVIVEVGSPNRHTGSQTLLIKTGKISQFISPPWLITSTSLDCYNLVVP